MNRIFDPVGHGATTIRYSSIPSENIHHLAEVLQKGWNLQDLKEIQKIEAYSAARSVNYRITSAERELVLKRSLINSVSMQEFQHQYMKFLRESGLHIPEVIPSSDGTTYSENSELYCLYQFIGGEYFDGSRDELDSAARNIALLEQVLKRMPFQEEIKIRKGSLIHHDYNALEELEKSIHSSRRNTENELVISVFPTVKKLSSLVMNADLENLPLQIIHYDLHPHNLLFSEKGEFKSFLDFDPMLHSQRIRDVGKALYRLSRTYGPLTERNNDGESDLISRAKFFLDSYLKVGELTPEELKALPYVIIDDPLRHLVESLKGHYFAGKKLSSLEKKITLLQDATLFLTARFP